MATLRLQIVPDISPAIQLYGRVSGLAVGTAIPGVADPVATHLYSFTVNPPGDYEFQLTGVSTTNGSRVPLRVTATAAYAASEWWEIETAIAAAPVIPSAITGLCNLLIAVTHNGDSVPGATVTATLQEGSNTVDGYLAARTAEIATTGPDGTCVLTLIQGTQFTRGGTYRIQVSDRRGMTLHDRYVRMPNTGSANLEDLADAV